MLFLLWLIRCVWRIKLNCASHRKYRNVLFENETNLGARSEIKQRKRVLLCTGDLREQESLKRVSSTHSEKQEKRSRQAGSRVCVCVCVFVLRKYVNKELVKLLSRGSLGSKMDSSLELHTHTHIRTHLLYYCVCLFFTCQLNLVNRTRIWPNVRDAKL